MGTIYVLDDEETVQRSARVALEPLGRVVTSALWSELSRDLLGKPSAGSLLVCDLEMPGIRGVDLCQILRRYKPDLPIVMFTARPEDVPRGLVDQVVAKRSGLLALREAVAARLPGAARGGPAAEDELSRAQEATQRALNLSQDARDRL